MHVHASIIEGIKDGERGVSVIMGLKLKGKNERLIKDDELVLSLHARRGIRAEKYLGEKRATVSESEEAKCYTCTSSTMPHSEQTLI